MIIVGVIVVVVVVILAIVLVRPTYYTATIKWEVYTSSVVSTIFVTLYFNNAIEDSGTLEPGYYAYSNSSYQWTGSSTDTLIVSATSTGGLLGSTSDSKSITVVDGGTYTVILNL